jgi:hypothetical protein
MKRLMSVLALAVAGLLTASMAFADGQSPTSGSDRAPSADQTKDAQSENKTSATDTSSPAASPKTGAGEPSASPQTGMSNDASSGQKSGQNP